MTFVVPISHFQFTLLFLYSEFQVLRYFISVNTFQNFLISFSFLEKGLLFGNLKISLHVDIVHLVLLITFFSDVHYSNSIFIY